MAMPQRFTTRFATLSEWFNKHLEQNAIADRGDHSAPAESEWRWQRWDCDPKQGRLASRVKDGEVDWKSGEVHLTAKGDLADSSPNATFMRETSTSVRATASGGKTKFLTFILTGISIENNNNNSSSFQSLYHGLDCDFYVTFFCLIVYLSSHWCNFKSI